MITSNESLNEAEIHGCFIFHPKAMTFEFLANLFMPSIISNFLQKWYDTNLFLIVLSNNQHL